MKKKLTTLLTMFLSCFFVGAQPVARNPRNRHVHHTVRLPGVNERRLAQLEKMREANLARRHRQGPWRVNEQNESKKGLVLLVEFSDVKLKNGAANQWNNRFNQQGFSQNNHIGSVRDYFIEQSYGQLTIDFDVVGPITLAKNHNYYGTTSSYQLDDRAPEMVIEALKLADPQVNFADYDWDGDGEVDQVYVIFAGQTFYGTPGYIWPHEWFLSEAQYYGSGSGRQWLDNVYIDTYAVSNELAGANTLEGIGTACHEFSHCLGFPDFYDTSYDGGTAGQNWDLLDGGSYNGPQTIGEVPSPYTAYERWTAGWLDLIPLSDPCRITDMPAINEEGVAYIIRNTGNSNEYYILENRQRKTFGSYNYGHGLMVWHIDYNMTIWNNNQVNADKNHQRMTFLPADGKVGDLQGDSYNGYTYYITAADEAGDPYPGSKKVKEVQQLTWFRAEKNGTKTHANLIHNISETADGKISFTYGDFVSISAPELLLPTNLSADSFTANWLPVEGATSYTLQVELENGEAAPETIFSEGFSGFVNAGSNSLITNSVVNKYTQTQGWAVSNLYGTGEASARVGGANAAGHITTPAIDSKAGRLTVEFDAAYYNTDGSSAVVSVLNDSQIIASQTIALTASRATYTCTFEDIPSGCKVKFASTAKNKRFCLYNVNIMDMSGTGKEVRTYSGLTTTSYTVEPIESDMYYYRVQAVCDEGPSDWSEWMSVDMADAIVGTPFSLSFREGYDPVYDLSGCRLQRVPQRGLFIRNGKVCVAP